MSISREALWCCGILVREVFGEWSPKERRLVGILTLLSSECSEDPEDEGVRSLMEGLLLDRLEDFGPFFKSVEMSKEFVWERKKVATPVVTRCGILKNETHAKCGENAPATMTSVESPSWL